MENGRWELDEEGENKGLREKAFKHWKTGFLSSRLQNFSLLHINNRYKYDNQMSKYKKESDNLLVSNQCTFCKLVDLNTTQVESREHIYLKCYSSFKVLKETSEAIGIVINDLDTKGYETLLYKQEANVWEETRENIFFLLYRYHIFQARAGYKLPSTDTFKMELWLEILMIIKINAWSRYLLDKLLQLWGGNEINLLLAEKLRKESTNDEVMATLLKTHLQCVHYILSNSICLVLRLKCILEA